VNVRFPLCLGGVAACGLLALAGCGTTTTGNTGAGVASSSSVDAVPAVVTDPPTPQPTPTPDPPLVCIFKVEFFDGTSVVEQESGVDIGWTNSTNNAPVNCQSLRLQLASGFRVPPQVTFATPPSRAPQCTADVNGIAWTVWANGDLPTARTVCTSLTGNE
jgi:hypothetical protein